MLIKDVINPIEYLLMLKEGYVREQTHPTEPLKIMNYTEKAQFDQRWNNITLMCRGLIMNTETGELVARPLPKFFNYDHAETPKFDMGDSVVVMDKADGSLGISYKIPSTGKLAIATRGSFASEQAIHATEVLDKKYLEWAVKQSAVLDQYTALFEIVYPENRIVLNYNGMDDLILLGMMDIKTGKAWTASAAKEILEWPGPVVEEFGFETWGQALSAPPRDNAEGFVVFFPGRNTHVKVKQEDYIAIHRIVTGLNERTVWQSLKEGKTLEELIDTLPDEFHEWVRKVWEDLSSKYDALLDRIDDEYDDVIFSVEKATGEDFDPVEHRKMFAQFAKLGSYTGFLFQTLDGKNFSDKIWDLIKPDFKLAVGREIDEDNT